MVFIFLFNQNSEVYINLCIIRIYYIGTHNIDAHRGRNIQSSIIFSDIELYLQPCVRPQRNNNIICTAVVYDITIRFHPIDASADSLHAHPNSKQCATLIFHQVTRVRLMCCAGLGVSVPEDRHLHIFHH